MTEIILDFEKPIIALEKKISDMKMIAINENIELENEINQLENKLHKMMEDTYAKLNRWQRVQLARHPDRPQSIDLINRIFTDFTELHGDRVYADDPALIAGIAFLDNVPVMVMGQQKGRSVKEKLYRNFGMMNPEGYRKAIRLMKFAAKFSRPVFVFIDTMGAYPGLGAEERGQGEAIARNLFEMARLPVPIIITIIGEGASGGALGIGAGDRVLMMENSWYSVISPEGCAAILWRDSGKAPLAADALRLTADDLIQFGVIDEIIKEPVGGAHRNYDQSAKTLKKSILKHYSEIKDLNSRDLLNTRIDKYAAMGYYKE